MKGMQYITLKMIDDYKAGTGEGEHRIFCSVDPRVGWWAPRWRRG